MAKKTTSLCRKALFLIAIWPTALCLPLFSESQQVGSPEEAPPFRVTPQGNCPDLGCGPCQPAPDRTDIYPCIPCNRNDRSCFEVPPTETPIPNVPPLDPHTPEVPPTAVPQCVKLSFTNTSQAGYHSDRILSATQIFPPVPTGLPSCLTAAVQDGIDYYRYVRWNNPLRGGPTLVPSWRKGCERHCDALASRNQIPGGGKTAIQTAATVEAKKNLCVQACATATTRRWVVGGTNDWGYPDYNSGKICDNTCGDIFEAKYADDVAIRDFLRRFGGMKTAENSGTLKCFRHCNNNPKCNHYNNSCVAGEYYLDAQCNVLPMSKAANCTQSYGITYEPSSPISLLWGGQNRVDATGSLVRFKLDLSSNETWSVWYGSSETPLLVHDPARTRRVTSAAQLFGNWSFGGKNVAKLHSASRSEKDSSERATPWANGYEALKTLDTNGDGFIRDSELSDLALWFDENRDAQSQPGEIVDIRDAGVTSLSLGPTRTDPLTRHVEVANGFTRLIEGREVAGTSVDWYGDSAETMQQLAIEQRMKGSVDTASLDELLPQRPSYAANPSEMQSNADQSYDGNIDSKVTGFWSWRAETDPNDTANRGTLVMRELKDGSLEVLSLTESPMKDSEARVSGVLSFQFMAGSAKEGKSGGSPSLSFSSVATAKVGDAHEPLVTSEGVFKDANTIIGKTTEVIRLPGQTQTIKYGWIATRTLPPE